MISYLKRYLQNFGAEFVKEIQIRQMIQSYTALSHESEEKGTVDTSYFVDNAQLIVSLTTYSSRIHEVFLVIETIFRQTLKPNKVILWLHDEEFDINTTPLSLKRQEPRGLEIRFCKNLYSYTKLIPTLKEHPDDVIVTIDDDILYPFDMLERLVVAYKQDPSYIYFHVGSLMLLKHNGAPMPYVEWGQMNSRDICEELCKGSSYAFPTGVGGVLYPPHSLHEDVLRDDIFLKICPTTDDLWFKMMALKAGTPARLVPPYMPPNRRLMALPDHQEYALHKTNNNKKKNVNDVSLKAILDHYGVSIPELISKKA